MKTQLPSTQSLRAFEAVARYLNCGQAALELCLTPSAVSKQLQSLEDCLGMELFVRGKHGLVLNEAGQAYWKAVRAIMRQLEEAGERVVRQGHHLQDLDVRVLVAFAERWLLPRYSAFAEANPDLKVHFDTSAMHDEDLPCSYDAYIRYGTGYWPGCVADYLAGRHLVIVASPDLLRRNRPIETPAGLAGFALFGHSWIPAAWSDAFRTLGVPHEALPPVKNWDFFSMTIRSACVGHGLALVPQCFVTGELERGELVQILGYRQESPFGYYFVFSESRQDDATLGRFRNWLRSRRGEGEEAPPGP
jgi:LysR family transcriptional regulator, glycine cleavage system transcriptional activator